MTFEEILAHVIEVLQREVSSPPRKRANITG
jgi:hypothetical protein